MVLQRSRSTTPIWRNPPLTIMRRIVIICMTVLRFILGMSLFFKGSGSLLGEPASCLHGSQSPGDQHVSLRLAAYNRD